MVRVPAKHCTSSLFVALLASTALLLLAGGSALAKPKVGGDGKIHACYRVKGKSKGSLRVVRSAKAHCKRGERKVAWALAGPAGPAGSSGQPGSSGSSNEAALQAKISALTLKVESLESVLQNISNEDLMEAVNSLPVIESLCTQASSLTDQTNLLGTTIGGIALGGTVPSGLLLSVPATPTPLSSYTCP